MIHSGNMNLNGNQSNLLLLRLQIVNDIAATQFPPNRGVQRIVIIHDLLIVGAQVDRQENGKVIRQRPDPQVTKQQNTT